MLRQINFNNLPNIFSLVRILCIPFIVMGFFLPYDWSYMVATFFFVFASLTDWLDGFLARKFGLQSSFGAFIDPVADKLVVVTTILLLVEYQQSWTFTLCSMIIVGRELVVSAVREWAAQASKKEYKGVAVSWIGKAKTSTQMVAITILLISPTDLLPQWMGLVCFYLATILTLVSMIDYLKIFYLKKN